MVESSTPTVTSNDVAFPRGGSSSLTPLEVKEISNEVTKDVLFETANSGSKRKSSSNQNNKRKKARRGGKKSEPSEEAEEETKTVRIESLTFKNLIPGTQVLGEITKINKLDLTISIGDNLVGYVPITNISEEITKQVEQYAANEEESDDEIAYDDDDNNDKITTGTIKNVEFPNLQEIFQIGQWINAKVVEPSKESQKKRIELSIEPETLNKDLEDDDLIPGNSIQASVKSIEDHVVILNIGKSNDGFILKKDLKKSSIGSDLKPGRVILTSIVSKDARAINLKPIDIAKSTAVQTISSIDAIRTGILVNALVSEVTKHGIVTKVFGLVDGTINLANTNEFDFKTLQHKYGVGNNIKARVVGILLKSGTKKLMLSLAPHISQFGNLNDLQKEVLEAFPVGYKFDEVTIKNIDTNYLYVELGNNLRGQIHLSKVDSDKTFEVEYSIGTKHKARVVGYNPLDNLLILSMDPKTINAKYLNSDEIPSGELFKDIEIVKVLPDQKGINVKMGDFEGFVPPMHMSDVKLIYPERKFKAGTKVRGRILKKQGRKLLVTLKKSLVNIEDEEVLNSFENATVGFKTPATVEKFVHNGAIVSFFGNLAAFLPKNEISETFVNEAKDFIKIGQSLNVRIMSVNEKDQKLVVTLKQASDLTKNQSSYNDIISGKSIVNATIVEKAKDSIVIELDSKIKGVIFNGHLSDGNFEQNRVIYKKLTIGEQLEVLVLEKDMKNKSIIGSCKKSLIEASKSNQLPVNFKDIKVSDTMIQGYIKSVTNMGLFVSFGGKLTGLVLAKYASDKKDTDLSKKFYKYQSISCRVIRVDEENKRFLLTLKDIKTNDEFNSEPTVNPIDGKTKNISDYQPGLITSALIKSVKGTQLNVQLADNLQGRIDITQCFNNWDEIKDVHQPLSQFHKDEKINVKVIGYHDPRNHKFLPVTHRKSNKHLILELSMLEDVVKGKTEVSEFSSFEVGKEYPAFINNISKGFVWVSLTPSVKGRISFMELSDDVEVFNDIDNRLPIGTAVKAIVKEIDHEHNVIVLKSRKSVINSFDDVEVGNKYPAKVLKVKDTYVLVELADKIVASSFITDALDDYNEKLDQVFQPNDYTTATVLAVDKDTEKIAVSLRTETAKDKLINTFEDLTRGDVVKGFVKNVASNGVYVSLGRSVHALVRVTDLSDSYLKDWKKFFKPHQPIVGKVSACDGEGKIKLTLKESEVNGELKTFKKFDDLEVGEVFEGSVKSVTDFGVFVKLDGTLNVNGLCHHSEISDNSVEDLSKLFGEGDRVKVKILKIDETKKQLSLGMKASYFTEDVEMEDAEEEVNDSDVEMESENESDESDEDNDDEIIEVEQADESSDEEEEIVEQSKSSGLSTGGFDWTASILDQAEDDSSSDEDEDFTQKKKKKSKGKKFTEDKTGDINTRAPQSTSDFERLILGNPNSSILWMNYMSFQLQLSEIDKAREIGERALKTIKYNDEQEKLNIWIALLNLENSFGTEETLEETFKKSCQFMDSLTMHQKLASIFIMSENYEKVDDLYKKIFKKFGSSNVHIWVSYASNLLDRKLNDESHEILAKALQSLPKRDHIEVVKKFAQLEYEKGELEQGRSLFEGLISDAPKRIDLWNVYIDKEIKAGDDKEKVEDLFERVITKKLSRKQAKFFFNKWVEYEESLNDEKGVNRVNAKAREYVEALNDN